MGEMADLIADLCEDDDFHYRPPRKKMCRYCKKRGLVWILQKAGWRLSENGRTRHICPEFNVVRVKRNGKEKTTA